MYSGETKNRGDSALLLSSSTKDPILSSSSPSSLSSSSSSSETESSKGNNKILMGLYQLFLQIVSDVLSYIAEYGLLSYLSSDIQAHITQYYQLINENDIVIVAKTGCGYCENAKKLLNNLQQQQQQQDLEEAEGGANERAKGIKFTQSVLIGTDLKIKNAISIALNLSDLTYPQIVIRGRYVGGYDDLSELVKSNEFEKLLSMNRNIVSDKNPIEWYAPLLKRSQTPELFIIPGDSKYFSNWYFFQGYMYSNLVRYISMFHTIILALCLILVPFADSGNTSYKVIQVALSILLIDILGILAFGPSPFSLSGVVSTYFGWKYKGNTTSSLPYKFVWLLYVISLTPYLFDNSLTSNGAIATLTSTLTNSIVLVVFRF